MTAAPLKVFISYRQADEKAFVESIRMHFVIRYGHEHVFMDVDPLPGFSECGGFIRQKIQESDAVVVIIGRRWRTLWDQAAAAGTPDPMRIALEYAIKTKKLVFPVRILGAPLPSTNGLALEIQQLFSRNAFPIADAHQCLEVMPRLIDKLEKQLVERGMSRDRLAQTGEISAITPDGHLDVDAIIKLHFDMLKQDRLCEALYWLVLLRDSQQAIPAFYELDRRISELESHVRADASTQQRRETADYLYKFVRHMVSANDTPAQIRGALDQVWKIEPGYDPDGIAVTL